MKISREARKIARGLFRLSMKGGRLDRGRVAEISDRVVAAKPRAYLEILKEYSRLIRLELEQRHAIVQSATDLGPDTRSSIEKALKQRFGDDITTEFRSHPSLLGGIRIKIGSDVWDGSVRGRLTQLSQQL